MNLTRKIKIMLHKVSSRDIDLIKKANDLSKNPILWYEVDSLVKKAESEDTRTFLSDLAKMMYHREMFSNDF